MPSGKHNSEMPKATGLISSLFNVALSQDGPFHQLQLLQYLHPDSTKAYVCSSLFSIPSSIVIPLHHGFVEDLITAVIAEVFLMLLFCLTCSVKLTPLKN